MSVLEALVVRLDFILGEVWEKMIGRETHLLIFFWKLKFKSLRKFWLTLTLILKEEQSWSVC